MNNAGWIVISEPAWRGWRAYVDDHRVGHQIANLAFLGVYVPRGAHHVRVVYWPQSFVIGSWISAATLLLIACAFAARIRVARAARRATIFVPPLEPVTAN